LSSELTFENTLRFYQLVNAADADGLTAFSHACQVSSKRSPLMDPLLRAGAVLGHGQELGHDDGLGHGHDLGHGEESGHGRAHSKVGLY